MTYDMLPPNSSGDDHVDGIEHEVQHRSRYHPIKHYEEIKILLQIYSAFAITLLCVLLFMNLLVWQGKPPNRDNDDAIQSTYARDKRFMTLDPMYDQLWDSMFPDGHLEIMLPDEELGGEVPATISMFHQLHCLSSLRGALQDAHNGKDIGYDNNDDKHWPHCLDYLRRTILCLADGTFERPPIINGTRAPFIDGARDVRQCRKTEPLYELLQPKD